MTPLESIREIAFPAEAYARLVDHARRKLREEYLPGEEQERKAYGLVGGRLAGSRADVTHVCPLVTNLRYAPAVKPWIDAQLDEVAIPSETPLDRRGWVADPAEVMRAERACEAGGSELFGNYHMHRVPWESDPRRDTCTEIDTRLAEGCGLWVLILSMVDPERPILRAFYEGDNHAEARVTVAPTASADTGEAPAARAATVGPYGQGGGCD